MRKIVLLAAMLIAPGLSSVPAQAGDRGHGRHHFAPPSHHRHFQPRDFGHSGNRAVFQFRSGSFGFRHGPPALVRPPHHVWRPAHRAPLPTFGRHPYAGPWHGFAPRRSAWWGWPPHRR